MTAKKATLLDKDSKHPYSGKDVYFATQHSKDKVLAPLLNTLGIRCIRADVDTDMYGTFTGEVERTTEVRETLRLKAYAAAKLIPNARFLLASEGSFGPHPFMNFLPSDHEALLFVDKKLDIEIYVEEISTKTNYLEIEFESRDNLQEFLKQIGFPEHGIIVKLKENKKTVFKNLHTLHELQQAILNAFAMSSEPKIVLSTDMRANFNPTRMKVIKQVGKKLVAALNSFCPECKTVGFAISTSFPGLPCADCGHASQTTKDVLWSCVKCNYTEKKARPDGKTTIPAACCELCNP